MTDIHVHSTSIGDEPIGAIAGRLRCLTLLSAVDFDTTTRSGSAGSGSLVGRIGWRFIQLIVAGVRHVQRYVH